MSSRGLYAVPADAALGGVHIKEFAAMLSGLSTIHRSRTWLSPGHLYEQR